ncbi:glycerophosphodiester phosphodiesterase [Devosia rhodophyticola]|uniref:Glycerophosphodiester phosphodiesterase n=1 Tax=Devosia rhodophyticola TaxID=3026423 RepID=A0ABY7YWS4_9HYPH|nr:glycerophosphodiester phosphodiesterase family protein [Devosia rhodophyticola]WDR05828.1 glycerophosphodiester phosphodiesterase [Devosia rhodophyticola]
MTNPISIVRNGHVTWLKWHRGRKTASDANFTGARILEGMRVGASVEVDLVVHGDRGYAVLHDLTLDRETMGSGVTAERSAAYIRELRLRDNDGVPFDEKVMLLEDLCALLANSKMHPDAVLQLDYKQDAAALDSRSIASFKASVGPVARHMLLSSGDAEAVRLLSEGLPELRIGYDPCHDGALERLQQSHDFAVFIANAIAASPRAEIIYLYFGMVLEAAKTGFDVVAALHAGGRRVDAYTIQVPSSEMLPDIMGLLDLKVDQITTDDPERMAALVGDR